MVQPAQTRIKTPEYFELPAYQQHDLIQLIDGEVLIGMPPIPQHQRVVREILYLLMTIARKTGGEAFDSPIEVYLDDHNVFAPDVLYLLPQSACVVEEKRLVGPPELVVEVLSPSTAKYDPGHKYDAYEQHGVKEYWIVDPLHAYLEVFTLTNGTFLRQGVYVAGDTLASHMLGEDVRVTTIFGILD